MKKIRKAAAYLLTLAILCGCFNGIGSVKAAEELPVTVKWDLNEAGRITGTVTVTLTQEIFDEYYGKSDYELHIDLLKDGNYVTGVMQPLYSGTLSYHNWDFDAVHIQDSGQYQYEILMEKENPDVSSGNRYETTLVAKSEVIDYIRPQQELATPPNIRWDENNVGTIIWDAVDGADSYLLWLRSSGSGSGMSLSEPSLSIRDQIQGDKEYYVTVQAYSKDPTVIANSRISEPVDIDTTGITKSVSGKLSDIMNDYNSYDKTNAEQMASIKDEVAGQVANLTADANGDINQNELNALQIGMQSNPYMLNQVKQLEELYAASNQVNVSTNVDPNAGFDSSKVSIIGAALNGDAGSDMSFGIEKADENSKVLVDQSMFNNPVQYNFTLSGTFNGTGEFRIPVRVTMPNPSNTPVYKLVILHYKADGSYETIRPYDNGDGTISFTVTSFSPFVFAEEVEADQNQDQGNNQNQGNNQEQGNNQNQGNNQDQGNNQNQSGGSNDKAPVWKPTAEEQKRMNYKGQFADVSNIVSNYKVSFQGVSQGALFFQSVAALGDKYTMLCTYNVMLDHQLLYEHEGVTRITMKLPSYYQELEGELVMVGVDKQGTPIVCADLDDNAQTLTFEVADAYAYALCSLSK
jgi:hypothetical protein